MMPVSADGTFRVSATDLKVGPHTIPAGKHRRRLNRLSTRNRRYLVTLYCFHAGVPIWIPFAATFNHPSVWESPDEYRPVGIVQASALSGTLPVVCRWDNKPAWFCRSAGWILRQNMQQHRIHTIAAQSQNVSSHSARGSATALAAGWRR
jgi:hypothetical protein